MKKIKSIFFCTTICILLGACSTSEDDNNDKNKVISKVTIKFLNLNDKNEEIIETESFVFSYKDGKIFTITNSKNNFTKYNFDNNFLLSITNSTDTKEDNNSITNEYSNGQLSKSLSEEQVSEYFYDSNSRLTEVQTKYIGSEKKYSTKLIYSGNNIVNTISDRFWNTTPEVVTYRYDNKNNPLKNANIYYRMLGIQAGSISENNVIEERSENQTINYGIKYDSDNFPIKVTAIVKETGKLWIEQNFEYTKI